MNALDDYFMEKEALFGGLGRMAQQAERSGPRIGEIAGNAAIQFGVAAALAGTAPVAAKVYGAITKRHNYNQMLHQNPDLMDIRDESDASARQFNNMYNSFHRLNPQFAGDPTVSGTYMRKMMAHPEGAGNVIVESLRGVPPSPFVETLRAGAGAGTKAFSTGIGERMKRRKEGVDPFAAQRQRVEGMGLEARERELHGKLNPPQPSSSQAWQDQMRQNIEDANLEMKHQDVVTRAHRRGLF